MQPVASTVERLAEKALNHNINKKWVDWAVEMLMNGFDTEYLVILAGMSEPFEQFEMQEITDKVLKELELDYSDQNQVVKEYVRYLLEKGLKQEMELSRVLFILKNIESEMEYPRFLNEFYSLYWAKEDLMNAKVQWYIAEADRSNIDSKIIEYFKHWLTKYSIDNGIISKVVGQMTRHESFADRWESLEVAVPLFNDRKLVVTFLDYIPGNDDSFMADADEAVCSFLRLCKADLNGTLDLIYQNYLTVASSKAFKASGTVIKSIDQIWKSIDPIQVFVRRDEDNDVCIVVTCSCDWQRDDGIQLVFRKGARLIKAEPNVLLVKNHSIEFYNYHTQEVPFTKEVSGEQEVSAKRSWWQTLLGL